MKDFSNTVIDLYKEKKWKEIVENFHDHPERSRLLWVYPTEGNFDFMRECLATLDCDRIISIGCGSGLLEWMITEATGLTVLGIEVDSAWWRCKYAPPTFIPLLFTPPELDKDIIDTLKLCRSTGLLFCYFNNRPAFEDYLRYFSGNVLIIIGPGDGKGVHTDPKPFNDVSEDWTLFRCEEVRNSRDFIAIYCKY